MLIDLHSRAEDDLSYIRKAMARAEGLSTVSGKSIMVMGGIALIAGALANSGETLGEQMLYWLAAAPVAALAGIIGSVWKSRRRDTGPLLDPVNRFLLCLIPPITIAAVVTHSLWATELSKLLPCLWLLCYGCGVLAAGTYAARPIAIMGAAFLGAGLISMTLPTHWLNTSMTLSFGLLHLIFGWQVMKHHGG